MLISYLVSDQELATEEIVDVDNLALSICEAVLFPARFKLNKCSKVQRTLQSKCDRGKWQKGRKQFNNLSMIYLERNYNTANRGGSD